mmetsp:Transcript_10504/g.23979  ORF Transcript_10504/g.23979 Transcript_10504/m.23979 type:complete len:86 (-) Transcript_10504:8-265(-)
MYSLTSFDALCRCLWEFGDTLLLMLCPLDIDHPLLIALDIFVAISLYDTKCQVSVRRQKCGRERRTIKRRPAQSPSNNSTHICTL